MEMQTTLFGTGSKNVDKPTPRIKIKPRIESYYEKLVASLGAGSGRKIFPICCNDQKTDGKKHELSMLGTNKISTFNSKNRVYDPEGISKTLSAGNKGGGESGQRTGLYRVHCTQKRGSDRPSLIKNKNAGGSGPLNKQDGTVYCLDTGNTQAVEIEPYRIRRLTPTECERLQGFDDGWTKGISDSQRYKCLGNALTVKVAQEIIKKMEMN